MKQAHQVVSLGLKSHKTRGLSLKAGLQSLETIASSAKLGLNHSINSPDNSVFSLCSWGLTSALLVL